MSCTEPSDVIYLQDVTMRRRAYCCDASRDLYEEYYARQNGGEIPVFAGSRFQRGHGLGNILGGFFRRLVLPFLKTNSKTMLQHAVKTGMDVANDVIDGKSFKESVKTHVPAGIKRTARNLKFQSGSGVRRVKRKRRKRDVFSA